MKRTQSQIGKHSRRKGKKFENWCARYFSQWTGLKWSSTRNSGRTDLKGDIFCVSRPDLPLVVECKHDKRYSVHAMLKPTKAWTDMIIKCNAKLPLQTPDFVVVVKNDTGIWIGGNIFGINKLIFALRRIRNDGITTKNCGVFIRLQHLNLSFKIDGVIFNGQRMDSVGKKGEG